MSSADWTPPVVALAGLYRHSWGASGGFLITEESPFHCTAGKEKPGAGPGLLNAAAKIADQTSSNTSAAPSMNAST